MHSLDFAVLILGCYFRIVAMSNSKKKFVNVGGVGEFNHELLNPLQVRVFKDEITGAKEQ